MTIACFGSLAFDRLMAYPGRFGDHLVADRLDSISLSLLVESVSRVYGGTAGNIGYNLRLLGERPLLLGCLGDDPDGRDYAARLKGWGLSLAGVKVHEGQMTAGCVIASDAAKSQFTFFHPGAMNLPCGFDLATLPAGEEHLVIISPAGAGDMRGLAADCRRLGLKFILDPGQQIPALGKDGLLEALDGAFMLICNEYEMGMIKQATGLRQEDLFTRCQVVIVTRGAEGCEVLFPGRGSQHVLAAPVAAVGDPTGAGDAFRAGLLKGLALGEHVISAARLGSVVAAFRVESPGGPQDHKFTPAEVMIRLASVFNEEINLLK